MPSVHQLICDLIGIKFSSNIVNGVLKLASIIHTLRFRVSSYQKNLAVATSISTFSIINYGVCVRYIVVKFKIG